MEFDKYMHIERFGTDEVEGIEIGECWVFPKIDGTNASVWMNDDGVMCAGSRNRELTLDNDNAGFLKAMCQHEGVIDFLTSNPHLRLYGEWLVPHSLKTYREDAWRKFYVFDVRNSQGENFPYLAYKDILEAYDIDYIPPIRVIKNGSYDDFIKCLEENTYLIQDGQGAGEGIVIKNYSYRNKYGRQTWAKIVRSEFKDKHIKAMGVPVSDMKPVELQIVDKFVTQALVEKEYEKIKLDNTGWQSSLIPQLLSRVYYELINEEMWHILKDYKNPKIDFKVLNGMCTAKVKRVMGWWIL